MNLNSQIIFRCLFVLGLLATAFFASWFMVIESAGFYNRFYEPGGQWDLGLWAAVLNEVFLLIMAAVWLPAIQTKNRRVVHPANLLVKLLVVFLFVNTVGGASFNVIEEKLVQIQQQKNRIQVLEVLQQQIKTQKDSFEIFSKQNQRLNTALSAREMQRVTEELKTLQSKQQSTVTLWLDITLLALLRFSIQLANITAVWLAGWLYRQPLKKQATQEMLELKVQPQIRARTPRKPKPKTTPALAATTVSVNEVTEPPKIVEPQNIEAPKIVEPQNTEAPKIVEPPKIEAQKIESRKATVATKLVQAESEESEAELQILNSNVLPFAKEVDTHANERLAQLRLKIHRIIDKLSTSTSLADLCRLTGVKETELRLLLSDQALHPEDYLDSAQSIHQKIEALYQQHLGLGYSE